jgi:hypothetical protein
MSNHDYAPALTRALATVRQIDVYARVWETRDPSGHRLQPDVRRAGGEALDEVRVLFEDVRLIKERLSAEIKQFDAGARKYAA